MSAIICALGVVILYIGSLIEMLDISMSVIASIGCIFAVIEFGGSAPWLIYAVTGLLSLLLLPQKLPAVMYILFFGYYPIIKEKIERMKHKWQSWVIKIAAFNIALLLMYAVAKWLLLSAETPGVLTVVFCILSNITFVIYDFALTRLISLYLFRLRKRFSKLFK